MTGWLARRMGERWLFWVLVTYAVNQTGQNLLRPMASYRALDLGMDATALGVLSASFAIAPLIVALRIGRWIDATGELPFILGGTVLMGVAGLGLADVWCVVVDLEFDADSTARLMRLVLGALEMRVL